MDGSKKSVAGVLKEHRRELMAISGVSGIGEGIHEGKPCIKVFVNKINPELRNKIPQQLGGYPVIVEETGAFRAYPKQE